MGVYARKDSPYWWLWLEPTGKRLSTGIPIGPSHQRKDSKRKAEDIYAAVMGDLARQRFKLPVDHPSITFAAHAAWYRDTVAKQHRGKRRATSIVNILIRAFGDTPLRDIDHARLEEWKRDRASAVSLSTVNRELDVLKPLLRAAVPKYLEHSPADDVKRFRVRRFTPITILTHEAEDRLLKHATLEERAFVLLGLDALMRMGDVRTFRAEYNHGAYLEIVDPKTGEPYKVPASERLQQALKTLTPKDGWYFARKYRKSWHPITENTGFRLFADLCKRASVNRGRKSGGVTFHGLRHTGATRALKATKATAVMRLGGWSSLRQLVRYDHPDDPDMIRGVEAIGSRSTHAVSETSKKPPKKRRLA